MIYKLDDNLYLQPRKDIIPASTKGYVHRYICIMDMTTGNTTPYDYLIKKELYVALKDNGYWQTFTQSHCNDKERVLYDADFPAENICLPILTLQYVLESV